MEALFAGFLFRHQIGRNAWARTNGPKADSARRAPWGSPVKPSCPKMVPEETPLATGPRHDPWKGNDWLVQQAVSRSLGYLAPTARSLSQSQSVDRPTRVQERSFREHFLRVDPETRPFSTIRPRFDGAQPEGPSTSCTQGTRGGGGASCKVAVNLEELQRCPLGGKDKTAA